MQRGQSNGRASFDSIPALFETIRIIPNVAARPPADVTKCGAQLSAPDEMSALIQSTHLHHDSYMGKEMGNSVGIGMSLAS